jgi:phosphopantetheinyl transferase (holo-ACP synthase)
LDWKDIEIINSKDGKPKLILHREIKNIASIDISLSHLKEYAVANAMILVENDPS